MDQYLARLLQRDRSLQGAVKIMVTFQCVARHQLSSAACAACRKAPPKPVRAPDEYFDLKGSLNPLSLAANLFP